MDAATLIRQFRLELPFHGYSPVTAHVSGFAVQAFLRSQPEPFPACFSYQNIVAYLTELRNGRPHHRAKSNREPSTVNAVLKALKRFADWAVSRELIPANPINGLRGLPERDRVILAPESPVVTRVLDAARAHGETRELQARNHALLTMLADIGMRANELLGIDIGDMDFRRRRVTLRKTKGGKERMAALNPKVVVALRAYLKLRRAAPGETAVFLSAQGQRMTYTALRNVLRKLCRQLGAKVSLHDFRRYALSGMWRLGMDELDLQGISGHEALKDLVPYIRAAVAERAVEKHREYSVLERVVATYPP